MQAPDHGQTVFLLLGPPADLGYVNVGAKDLPAAATGAQDRRPNTDLGLRPKNRVNAVLKFGGWA